MLGESSVPLNKLAKQAIIDALIWSTIVLAAGIYFSRDSIVAVVAIGALWVLSLSIIALVIFADKKIDDLNEAIDDLNALDDLNADADATGKEEAARDTPPR